MNNEDRAAIGQQILDHFTSLPQADNGDDEDNLTDILADLMHLFGTDAVEDAYRKASNHYFEEVLQAAEAAIAELEESK